MEYGGASQTLVLYSFGAEITKCSRYESKVNETFAEHSETDVILNSKYICVNLRLENIANLFYELFLRTISIIGRFNAAYTMLCGFVYLIY